MRVVGKPEVIELDQRSAIWISDCVSYTALWETEVPTDVIALCPRRDMFGLPARARHFPALYVKSIHSVSLPPPRPRNRVVGTGIPMGSRSNCDRFQIVLRPLFFFMEEVACLAWHFPKGGVS